MSRNPMPFYFAAGFTTTSGHITSPDYRMPECLSQYIPLMYDELIIYV